MWLAILLMRLREEEAEEEEEEELELEAMIRRRERELGRSSPGRCTTLLFAGHGGPGKVRANATETVACLAGFGRQAGRKWWAVGNKKSACASASAAVPKELIQVQYEKERYFRPVVACCAKIANSVHVNGQKGTLLSAPRTGTDTGSRFGGATSPQVDQAIDMGVAFGLRGGNRRTGATAFIACPAARPRNRVPACA